MTPAAFDAAARALPGATMSLQWGDASVYKVGGKMFAILSPGGGWSFKVSEIAFEALRSRARRDLPPISPARAGCGWMTSRPVM